MREAAFDEILVRAPGRLHLGFIDPDATLGRRFGSLGLMLDAPATELTLRPAERDALSAAPHLERELERVAAHLHTLRRDSGIQQPVALALREALAPHTGLGSGTQLALATGRAFADLFGWRRSTAELAVLLGRARRSGIGAAGFDRGGLLLDAGPGRGGRPAPVIAHLPFPAAWHIVLLQPREATGLHGAAEREALAALPPFPQAEAAHLAHLVLMQVLPAVIERDFTPFADALTELQQRVGEHFAPAQGGAFADPEIAALAHALRTDDGAAVGQTSWGPTGFAVLPSAAAATQALARLRDAGRLTDRIVAQVVSAGHAGARIARRAASAAAAGERGNRGDPGAIAPAAVAPD
jgi:beta-RFAP synthase